jgi:hypothetical protein
MMLGLGFLIMLLVVFAYTIYKPHGDMEGFYPRRWWWGGHHGSRWGWRHPWMHWWGNWRPYGYYPAYSGYWKQCEPSGTWCPATMSCNSAACQ